MLGILTLDTAFPRICGDVGAPETFAFPVRYARVEGATVDAVVHRRDDALLSRFVAAGQGLAAEGCTGIATTCGFLACWQRELAAALPVPVLASALLQVPMVERLLAPGRSVGVITYSAADLTPQTLHAAGVRPDVPVEGVAPGGVFARAIRHGAAVLDREAMAAEVVSAARRLLQRDASIAALVLECANMPPYRDAVAAATGLPVFDAAQLLHWFHAGLPPA